MEVKLKILSFFALLAVAFAAVAAEEKHEDGNLPIALREGSGHTVFSVSIPPDASPVECFAAEEFVSYVHKLTGVKLPVVSEKKCGTKGRIRLEIMQGFGESEYRVQTSCDGIAITGGKRGVLFGVYDLLERFGGVGWFSSWYSFVPSLQSFSVPIGLDEKHTPAFEMREVFWFDAFDGDYAARNRLDGGSMRFEPRHGGRSAFRFGGGLGNAHTFHVLMPAEEFYSSHPEYYSWCGGKRLNRRYQLCLSNPDVLRIVIERVRARIDSDPHAKYFGVSQEDNENYCRCDNCARIDAEEQSHAGTLIRFVNSVAAEIAKTHPGAVISTLAYQYSRKPPAKTRPLSNVMVVLCTSGCEFSRPLNASGSGGNHEFCRDLAEWNRLNGRLYIWDYNTNFRHFLLPFPNVKVLQENFRFFRDSKVRAMFAEGAYIGSHASFAELKAWLSAKWVWNPDLPLEMLLNRFMHGYYGKAAPLIRRYLDGLEALPKPSLRIAEHVDTHWLTDSFLEKADRIWRDAETVVADDAGRAYNVRMGRLSIVYTRLMRKLKRLEKSVWLCEMPVSNAEREEMAGEIEWIRQRMKEAHRPISFSEYESHEATLARWERFLRSGVAGNSVKSACFGVDKLKLGDSAQGFGTIISEPEAEGGKAYRIANTHCAWCVVKGFEDIGFDSTTNYLFRFRVKVEKNSAALQYPDLQAFTAGVYDENVHRNTGLTVRIGECKDGWGVYEIASQWPIPASGAYFWFAPGNFPGCGDGAEKHPALDAVVFDKLEIVRTGE